MKDFEVSIGQVEAHTVITVTGDLDATTCDRFTALATANLAAGARVVVDLTGLTFLDTSGLGALVQLWKWLSRNSGDMVLAGARYSNARALWVTGLADRIPHTDDLATAFGG